MPGILWLAIRSPSPTSDPSTGGTLSADTALNAVIAIITLLGIVGSIWIARRGQKQDQELATKEADRAERAQQASEASAERAEAAAALNIDALTRVADALEQPIANALERTARSAAERLQLAESSNHPIFSGAMPPFLKPARVKWSLKHFSGDKYMLENIGEATAYNVKLSAHESMYSLDVPDAPEVPPGEGVQFFALKSMATSDSTITVTWTPTEDSDEAATWRYPLPPRPPRR
jgi:hypothetical protein